MFVSRTEKRFRLFAIVAGWCMALGSSGCTIARYHTGVPLRGDPVQLLQGQSTKSDVLRLFGPPNQITHQTDGDAFVYARDQLNFASLTLQEPFTGQRLFTYRRQFENRDSLVVLFDYGGVVRGVAVDHRIERMPPL